MSDDDNAKPFADALIKQCADAEVARLRADLAAANTAITKLHENNAAVVRDLAAAREQTIQALYAKNDMKLAAEQTRADLAAARGAIAVAQKALVEISAKDTNADMCNGLEEGPIARMADAALACIDAALKGDGK